MKRIVHDFQWQYDGWLTVCGLALGKRKAIVLPLKRSAVTCRRCLARLRKKGK